MLRDVSDWERIGYGRKSTLEKEELISPEKIHYLIKYPRQFKEGVCILEGHKIRIYRYVIV